MTETIAKTQKVMEVLITDGSSEFVTAHLHCWSVVLNVCTRTCSMSHTGQLSASVGPTLTPDLNIRTHPTQAVFLFVFKLTPNNAQ